VIALNLVRMHLLESLLLNKLTCIFQNTSSPLLSQSPTAQVSLPVPIKH
jgi:hypothetical protein